MSLAPGTRATRGTIEALRISSLPAQLTQRGAVAEHARWTRHTRVVSGLPARGTRAYLGGLLYWTAVGDKLCYLPVNSIKLI